MSKVEELPYTGPGRLFACSGDLDIHHTGTVYASGFELPTADNLIQIDKLSLSLVGEPDSPVPIFSAVLIGRDLGKEVTAIEIRCHDFTKPPPGIIRRRVVTFEVLFGVSKGAMRNQLVP